MKVYWISLLSALTAVAGLNLYVDPVHRWHSGPYEFHQLWGSKDCRLVPLQMDETLLKSRLFDLIEKPGVMLFASSRRLQINSAMFAPNIKFFNASLSGADLWNYNVLWGMLKEAHKVPEKLILFLDSSQFRESKFIEPPTTKIQQMVRSFKDLYNTLEPKEL